MTRTRISRRSLLAAAALCAGRGLLPLCAAASPQKKPSPYTEDVEFLLVELEKQAGGFFRLKGIDWRAVSRQFRAEARKVKTDPEHIRLCTRLIARLRDGHAALQDVKVEVPDESKGRRFTGPRVHLLAQSGKVFVRAAFGPASQQGIQPGMEVVKIDSKPAAAWLKGRIEELRDDHGYSTDHAALYAACHWGLADWEGTRIDFELVSSRQTRRVSIVRRGGPNFAPFGPVFPPKDLREVGRQSYGKTAGGMAYLHLRDVPGDLPAQLDTMLGAVAGGAPGLVLDCRANGGGGCDHEAVFGRFLATGAAWRQYRGQGDSPFAGPMVVIVDAGVRSAGETIAGMLKEDGRAYMIGDSPTSGSSSQKARIPAPSGLFVAYISVASNKARFNGGKGIEGIGVSPHETVPYDPAEMLRGVDTQLRRADELLRGGFPKGKVAYSPPG